MLNTYITIYLLHVSVFVTPSSGGLFRYLLKTICFLECCCKMYNIPCFLIDNAAKMFKTICISSICILEILKMLVEILNCDTLKSVGPCYLLCMLVIYVFTVSNCFWVRNGAEILRGPRSCCYVVPLSWCAGLCR